MPSFPVTLADRPAELLEYLCGLDDPVVFQDLVIDGTLANATMAGVEMDVVAASKATSHDLVLLMALGFVDRPIHAGLSLFRATPAGIQAISGAQPALSPLRQDDA